MKGKIVVAGMGHGGLAAAAELAAHGYDVTVLEQKSKVTLGYDWTDIFDPEAFAAAGLPMPDQKLYTYKEDMTFVNPSMTVRLRQHVPQDKREIKMERRDLYAHLIRCAEQSGAKLVYDCKVLGPVIRAGRVAGVSTQQGAFDADLVIDACGMDSPVRKNLPAWVPVEKSISRQDHISIYRAFYDRACTAEVQDRFKVLLFADGICGISWVAAEESHTDLLIGRFADFDLNEVRRFADILRKTNPALGSTVLRGGQFVKIPVRQPLSVMVWNGYAAVGDSAFMTVPLIGSGIANSLRAARMLADTVLEDTAGRFDCEMLWQYQVQYYKKLGAGLAPLAASKKILLNMHARDIDYVFESGTLNEDNITMTADFHSLADLIRFDPADLLKKGKNLCKAPSVLKKLLAGAPKIAGAAAMCAAIPRRWNERAVRSWANDYEACFR